MATFALGTAAGDLTAATLGLGYFDSGLLFGALILVPLVAWRLGLNAVVGVLDGLHPDPPARGVVRRLVRQAAPTGPASGTATAPSPWSRSWRSCVLVGWVSRHRTRRTARRDPELQTEPA